uniref:Uncharacterized protein n=1 Tax=Felis catus TaxID=9685 RepID=A0ABI7WD52_FELCA
MVFSNNDEGLINKKLPKELLLRMLFSLLLNFTWSNPECTKYVHSIGLDSFCNVILVDSAIINSALAGLNHATRLKQRSLFKRNCHLRPSVRNMSIHRTNGHAVPPDMMYEKTAILFLWHL